MNQFKTVMVTGGAGYVGGVLIPKLLSAGYRVKVYDNYTYGETVFDQVRPHPQLEEIKGDIRDDKHFRAAIEGCNAIIHLACISNDPSCDLDPELTKTVNLDCFPAIVQACKDAGIKRFIFASSSSVYGLSDDPHVTEEHPKIPVTDYNRYKSMCEDILFDKQTDEFVCVSIRPATVCGYSPRLRLDLTVNVLTAHAVNKGKITVFGGSQYRPNLHIQDMTDLYLLLLKQPDEAIAGQSFNAGYQNQTVAHIASIIKSVVENRETPRSHIDIVTTPSDDVRSYRITCAKIDKALGFKPKRTIEDAVADLCDAFEAGKIPDPLTSTSYSNIKRMQEISLK
jgi:nucleoside-diphosphate-sugar epimerase